MMRAVTGYLVSLIMLWGSALVYSEKYMLIAVSNHVANIASSEAITIGDSQIAGGHLGLGYWQPLSDRLSIGPRLSAGYYGSLPFDAGDDKNRLTFTGANFDLHTKWRLYRQWYVSLALGTTFLSTKNEKVKIGSERINKIAREAFLPGYAVGVIAPLFHSSRIELQYRVIQGSNESFEKILSSSRKNIGLTGAVLVLTFPFGGGDSI